MSSSPKDSSPQTPEVESSISGSSSATKPPAIAATSTATATAAPSVAFTREELLELVVAIKFAKPEASQKEVHREITQDLSQKHEGFGFLKDVPLTDVKKVWKKALQQHPTSSSGSSTSTNTNISTNQPLHPNADLIAKLTSQNRAPEVFTVGDGSVKVQQLAHEYTAAVLAQAAANEQAAAEELWNDYVHVFLDVPADRSGSRPHQALINFQSSTTSSSTSSSTPSGSDNNNNNKSNNNSNKTANKKKKDKKMTKAPSNIISNTATNTTTTTTSDNTNGEVIVKIQMAAPLDEHDTIQHPMLLYNQTRTYKTFLHPDVATDATTTDATTDAASSTNEEESQRQRAVDTSTTTTTNKNKDGYQRIQEWIASAGNAGALGQAGGTKAYFYSRITTRRKKGQQSIISIRVTELAPAQDW
jgi:hypothetical protein